MRYNLECKIQFNKSLFFILKFVLDNLIQIVDPNSEVAMNFQRWMLSSNTNNIVMNILEEKNTKNGFYFWSHFVQVIILIKPYCFLWKIQQSNKKLEKMKLMRALKFIRSTLKMLLLMPFTQLFHSLLIEKCQV